MSISFGYSSLQFSWNRNSKKHVTDRQHRSFSDANYPTQIKWNEAYNFHGIDIDPTQIKWNEAYNFHGIDIEW